VLLYGHSSRLALGLHAAQAEQTLPLPKYPSWQAHVTLSDLVALSQPPKVSAWSGKHCVQLEQFSPTDVIMPRKSPSHWQVHAPSVELLFLGQAEHRFCAFAASKVPMPHCVQLLASLGMPRPVWYLPGPHTAHAAEEFWP
jgi:hypothetical protein